MVLVQHAGHTIEAEAIELILLHPESQVAEQEAQYLMVTVVEQSAVPKLVGTLWSAMEVLMIRPIELVESIQYVLGGVTVDDVK